MPRWFWWALMAGIVSVFASADEETLPYSQRIFPARQLSVPPTVDGDITDPVWAEAAIGEGFTDTQDGKLVPDQTRFWLAYDNEFIYFAAHCYDSQPDRLVMLETKRDSRLWADDHLTLELDPFHTHSWRDLSQFTVNPRGTQASQIGGGRSGKAEWKGEWKAASRVVEDGWTVEMAIPWAILSYPSTKEPVTVGFNVRRNHARARYQSVFSNLGPHWRNEYAGNWEGVLLPADAFRPEIRMLPFLAAGAAEQSEVWKHTTRAGLDLRYRPTSLLTAVVTVNPDFRNVQGEVEGIDFSRGERWVQESRPFFQEGDSLFNVGSSVGRLFYSRRIEKMDLGAKLYGKLARRTNVGVLTALDLDDQHNLPRRLFRQDTVLSLSQDVGEGYFLSAFGSFRSGRLEENSVAAFRFNGRFTERIGGGVQYASSAFLGAESSLRRGDLASVGLNCGGRGYWAGIHAKYLSPGFRNLNGILEFPGRRGLRFDAEFWRSWRQGPLSEVSGELFGEYEERYDRGNGFQNFDNLLRRSLSTLGERNSNPHFFRDTFGYSQHLQLRNNVWFSHQGDIGHFREENVSAPDRDWSWGFGFGGGNGAQTRSIGVRYSFGRADSTFRHFLASNLFYRRGNLSTGLNLSLLRHKERRQQHIWSVNYDLSRAMTMGGRLVFRRDERKRKNRWNLFVSFRRSGEMGYETFLIVGDPNADHFIPRLEGKFLLPL